MRLLSTLVALVTTSAAVILPAPQAVVSRAPAYPRQATGSSSSRTTTSITTSTVAWYAGNSKGGTITWVAQTITEYGGYHTTVATMSRFWRYCGYYVWSSGTSSTSYSPCEFFTTCSEGMLKGPSSVSTFCETGPSVCMTDMLYSSFGAQTGLSWLWCGYTDSATTDTVTSYYKESPTIRVLSTTTAAPTVSVAATPSATMNLAVPTTTVTGNPSSGPSNRTGIIAGSVIGGIAVLAIAAIALFFVHRRNPRHTPATPSTAHMSYVPSKAPTHFSDLPEYNPHNSAMYSVRSSSPQPTHSPMPLHAEAFRGGGLAGVTSHVTTSSYGGTSPTRM